MPTLGRRMLALEAATGQALFRRHTRGYDLTSDGTKLANRAREVAQGIAALAPRPEMAPVVRVSAGSWTTLHLCQDLGNIAGSESKARICFLTAEHVLDIRHREAVIGLRNHRPEQAGLAGQRLGQVRFAVYAANAQVKGWIRVLADTPSARWVAEQPGPVVAEVSAPRNALDLALAGAGRVVLPCFVGGTCAGLTRVSQPIGDLTHDQWLVSHEDARFDPPVRAVIDRIGDSMKRALRC